MALRMKGIMALLLFMFGAQILAAQSTWPRFRGPHGAGIADADHELPVLASELSELGHLLIDGAPWASGREETGERAPGGKKSSGSLSAGLSVAAPQEIAAPSSGSLVIAGGGRLPAELTDEFIRLAGGAQSNIVIIPTASAMADRPNEGRTVKLWKERGAGSALLLHTRSKEEANSEAFVAPLRLATGVWFGGGSQSRITEAYLGTNVEKELRALLDRGGVIGGSSAGAAIMTKVMITGGNPVARTGEGFGFLPGIVVDQHFLRRNRVNRLLGVLNRNPGLVGIGIDEGTALVRVGDELRAIGRSYVSVFVPQPGGLPIRVEILESGEKASLSELLKDAARLRRSR